MPHPFIRYDVWILSQLNPSSKTYKIFAIRKTNIGYRNDVKRISKNVMERKIKTFEDLEVWQFCRTLRIKLTKLAKRLPTEEKFLLANQMIRAAHSITNNIAEGYGRYHYQENIQYCRQSRGSLYESIDHLTVCLDDEYIATEEFQILRSDCLRGIQMGNGYIRFLEKQKDVNRKSNDG
jgi:four helix bundle protein